ncbi:MAG: transglycosylase SLT domain-containing protein [Planctomycetes bacterium]|nr:transglycosylase SLT domain-containing protein [Planctomycetota bacterium]
MSERRARGRGWRWASEHKWLAALLAVAVAFLVFEGAVHGPKVAEQVWSEVGMQRVEGHAEVVRQAAAESRVDPCLLAGIMYVESRGRVDAVSKADALGLFQLKVAAAGDAAQRLKLPPPSREALLSDPLLNARLAASHVAWLYRHEGPDLERILVAYNAGRGKLKQLIADSGSFGAWRAKRERDGKSETLQYARDVLRFADAFRERGVIVPPVARPAATTAAAPAPAEDPSVASTAEPAPRR